MRARHLRAARRTREPTVPRCPECNGALWEREDGELQGRVRTPSNGHAVVGDAQIARSTGVEPSFDVVAIASSAGGLAALTSTLSTLPADFPAAVLVVQHLDPRHRSLMAEILSRRTALAVVQAVGGEPIEAGTVYVAPPDHHLLANADRTLELAQTELVHFVRPSADLLFESVAAAYRERSIAVVLTGSGSDGAMGVEAVKKMGGTVLAQDESTSEFFSMPSAAIATGKVDFVLPIEEMAPALLSLVVGG